MSPPAARLSGMEAARPDSEAATDESLMRRFQSGDASAFEEMFRRHRRPIYNFILRFVGDRHTADDLLQEVFLRCVQGAANYQFQSKVTTWLYTIARNLCVDTGRKMVFRRHASLDGPASKNDDGGGPTLGERIASPDAGVDRSVIARQLQVRLKTAIESLSAAQREVFVMRQYSNLPFKQIAGIVGVPENTVKSRMRYALEQLRAILGEYEEYAKALR